MKKTKSLWRALLFTFLLTALCGSFALPVIDMSVQAAPQMQATSCTGTTFTQWTFENTTTPATGTGTFSTGSGLSSSYAAGNPGQSVSFGTWTPALDPSKYIDLLVPTSGRKSVVMTLDYRSTGSGPTALELRYSIDGTNFTLLSSPSTLTNDSTFHSLSFDLSAITGLDNNAIADFRLYAYGATSGNGTLRLDNITFTGNCLTSPELTGTAVVNQTSTAAVAITSTASAVNATGTASAVNATNTSMALSSTATYTASPTSTPSSGSATNVVISEFRTRGPDGANDEFIEIYNPTANAINISGWKVSASSSTGATKTTKATIPLSTLLQSGQYYLVINNNSSGGYSVASVPGNLTYTQGMADDGGIALLKADDTIVDQVGMSSSSAYKEGTVLSPLSTDTDQSYERKLGGASDSCQDTNNNANDFFSTASDPHNNLTPLSRCGTRLNLRASTTLITSDTPYTTPINANVTIHVKVTGGTPIPTGRVVVTVTGSTLTCTATLNASGIGSCVIRFTTLGTKTLVAVYLGDSTHVGSMYTTSHYVSTSTTSYFTPTPIPPPPPQLVVINEFVPRPGHDWNHDGVVNVGDEYIELLNHGTVDVNLSGWRLDDEVNVGSNPYSLPAKTIKPGERIVFYGSETGLLLGDGGDAVRLLKPNGQLIDAYNYTIARYPDESFCRLPDNGGADDWNQFCFPTPGIQNSLSGNFALPSTNASEQQSCPISDMLPADVIQAECDPSGNNIWNPEFWDKTGWYDEKDLPAIDGKWPVFAD